MIERSLVVLKPDAVQRGIIGEIIARFERAGLKVVAGKFMQVDMDLVKKHYLKDDAWKIKVGGYNLKDCETYGVSAQEIYGSTDPLAIGQKINEWLFDGITSGPVFALVLEGPQAVGKIRTLVGTTYPDTADPGTIRADYSMDSALTSLLHKRAVNNLVHASGTPEEAVEEIKLWFKPEELLEYKRPQDDL